MSDPNAFQFNLGAAPLQAPAQAPTQVPQFQPYQQAPEPAAVQEAPAAVRTRERASERKAAKPKRGKKGADPTENLPYVPASMRETPEKKPLFTVVAKKARPEDVGETLEDLASMLEAGESEDRALSELGRQYEKLNVGAAYTRAVERMRNDGATSIEALVAEDDVFPRVARELLAASTTPRDLHANLRHAAMLVAEASDVKAAIKAALFKPLLTLGIVIVFVVVAAEWLLPQVATMFESIGAATPPITVTMIAVGSSAKWVIGGLLLLLGAWGLYWLFAGRKNPKLRVAMDNMAIRMPLLGPITQMAVAARFAEVLAACLASGMNELDALEVAGRACGNDAVNAHVIEHIARQRVGDATFADVADTPLFPWNLKNRIDIAPGTRFLIDTLRDVGKIFHKKSKRRLDQFADRVGPLTEIVVLVAAAGVILMIAIPVTTFAPQMINMGGGY